MVQASDTTNSKRKVMRILSIDGGGIRGIIPAMILARLEQMTEKPIHKLFDLIAGTSTGGILALGLTTPDETKRSEPKFKASDLVDFYENEGREIFKNPNEFSTNVFRLNSLSKPKYQSKQIEDVLKIKFGEETIKSALTDILIPCYEIEHRIPFAFNSLRAKDEVEGKTWDWPCWEAARATSAAPIYFAPYKLEDPKKNLTAAVDDGQGTKSIVHVDYFALIDGGIYANNPTMQAIIEAKRAQQKAYADAKAAGREIEVPSDQFFILSIGTGKSRTGIRLSAVEDGGPFDWVIKPNPPLITAMLDAASESVQWQVFALFGSKRNQPSGTHCYHRLEINIGDDQTALDNVRDDNIRTLKKRADAVMDTNSAYTNKPLMECLRDDLLALL